MNQKILCKGVEVELIRQPIEEPANCPVCGHTTNKVGRIGAMTKCMNPACSAQAVGKVKRWIKSLDILGFGDELLAAMQTELGVNSPLDLYTLTEATLAPLKVGNGVLGASRAKAVLSEIQAKGKNLTIDEFLGSLGISFLGKRRVHIVREKANGALDAIEAWLDGSTLFKVADQCSIGGTVDTINLELQEACLMIESLLNYITIKPIRTGGVPAALSASEPTVMKTPPIQYTVVLTGAMSRKRNEIAADITAAGHIVKDSVAKGVTHLVMASLDSTSSKAKKAAALGVQMITEEQLMAML